MGNDQSMKSCQCLKLYDQSQLNESGVIQVYNNRFMLKGNFNFNKQSTFKKLQNAANQICLSSAIGSHYVPTIMRLLAFKHDNVFQAFYTLSQQNRIQFMQKIGQIQLDLLDSLYQHLILNQGKKRSLQKLKYQQLKPVEGLNLDTIKVQDKYDLISKGVGLLRSSRVAIVFMCAGASSRFYFQDKFLHTIQIQNQQTTILKVLLDKLRQNFRPKSKDQIINVPIVLIGNETNSQIVQDYMKENNFFSFNKQNVYFSSINSLPILDSNGKICLNFEYNHLRRPKGSACCVEEIIHPGAFDILKQKGIQYVHFVGTQNIAENPGDPLYLGLTYMLKRKVSIKCTDCIEPFQKFDRVIVSNQKIRILQSSSLDQIGQKSLFQSHIAMNSLIFEMNSLRQIVDKFHNQLQLAGLYRSFPINENTYDFSQKKPLINKSCWSFQKDIKDMISCAQKPLIVKVDRKQFIPVITAKHQYSIAEACQNYVNQLRKKPKQKTKSLQSQQSQQFKSISSMRSKNRKNGVIIP